MLGSGQIFRVLKVLEKSSIFIEVYETSEAQKLWARIQLPDKKDGYFHVAGQATNLAFQDLNSDGRYEILAPTYDASMNPHLNPISVDVESQKLVPYNDE